MFWVFVNGVNAAIISTFSRIILVNSLVSIPDIPTIFLLFNHSPKLYLPLQWEYFGLYSPTINALIWISFDSNILSIPYSS